MPDTPSRVRRDYAWFVNLVRGTSMVADRCKLYIAAGGPARETFDYFMERFASIRGRYRDLSPNEQNEIALEVEAVETDAVLLRRALGRILDSSPAARSHSSLPPDSGLTSLAC